MCSCLPINKTLNFFFPGFLRAPHKYFCVSYAQQYVSSTALFTKTNDYCKLIYLVDCFLNITIILNCLYVLKSFFIPFLLFSIFQVGSLKKLLTVVQFADHEEYFKIQIFLTADANSLMDPNYFWIHAAPVSDGQCQFWPCKWSKVQIMLIGFLSLSIATFRQPTQKEGLPLLF